MWKKKKIKTDQPHLYYYWNGLEIIFNIKLQLLKSQKIIKIPAGSLWKT